MIFVPSYANFRDLHDLIYIFLYNEVMTTVQYVRFYRSFLQPNILNSVT